MIFILFTYFCIFQIFYDITFIIGKLFEEKKKKRRRRKKIAQDIFLQRITGNQIPLTPKTRTFE